ncbi:MAG: GWxTD domain-containing protein [Cyclobacteriaceae bacterium]|nr:GWxTD domain-containing protein [Cyclobacteriaceae bacterium]MCH8516303.1 GWxTD domain-containing protein [Cyclobacteriaceae bacterium]
MRTIFFFCITFFLFGSLFASDYSKNNSRYRYDPSAEIQFNHQYALLGGIGDFFIRITMMDETQDLFSDYRLNYMVNEKYSSKKSLKRIEFGKEELIKQEGNTYFFSFTEDLGAKLPELVVVSIQNKSSGLDYAFDIPIKRPNDFDRTEIMFFREEEDIPIFEPYIGMKQKIRVVNFYNRQLPVHAFYYPTVFETARPPMVEEAGSTDAEIEITQRMTLSADDLFSIDQQGMVFFQTDSSGVLGKALLIKEKHYPTVRRVEELVDPLLYISSASEFNELTNSDNPKRALDQFWIQIGRREEVAKQVISNYYRRQSHANRYFSSYKPGWKADQGMIYMIFGRPDEVYRDAEGELWVYQKRDNMAQVRFNFVHARNIFSDNHYILIREKRYDRFWFRMVDLWRKARVRT